MEELAICVAQDVIRAVLFVPVLPLTIVKPVRVVVMVEVIMCALQVPSKSDPLVPALPQPILKLVKFVITVVRRSSVLLEATR